MRLLASPVAQVTLVNAFQQGAEGFPVGEGVQFHQYGVNNASFTSDVRMCPVIDQPTACLE